MRPTWGAFRRAYPDYGAYPAPAAVKQAIGGAADADWIVNTCALRMSRGLNGSGVTVPAHFPGLATVAGADRKRYAFRVAEVRRWLPHAIGKADFDHTKAAGAPFDKATPAQPRHHRLRHPLLRRDRPLRQLGRRLLLPRVRCDGVLDQGHADHRVEVCLAGCG